MRHFSPFLIGSLLLLNNFALAQFNTVKTIRILPTVEVDKGEEMQPVGQSTLALAPAPEGVPYNREEKPYSLPLRNPLLNSTYGLRIDPINGKEKFHYGLDFHGRQDTVLAVLPGIVKKVGYNRALGNYIEVEHGEYSSLYAHLSFILVRQGSAVKAGQWLGITGSTGRSTGEHLHFAIKHKGRAVDPTPYLDAIYSSLIAQLDPTLIQ